MGYGKHEVLEGDPIGGCRNLIHYNILDRGGHFAAWEQPALHAKEIRDCFTKVR
jgi:hypothetical protein